MDAEPVRTRRFRDRASSFPVMGSFGLVIQCPRKRSPILGLKSEVDEDVDGSIL